MHEGLHDGIIPLEVWEAVQAKLKAQAGCEKGAFHGKNRNLLTRRIFDAEGRPYSPSFTNKKDGRRYRYYVNKWLALDKAHPDYARARFPSHEIESVVEKAIRAELPQCVIAQDGAAYDYLIAEQQVIPRHELIRATLKRVVVHYDKLELTINPQPLKKLAADYLKIDIECAEGARAINVPYISERAHDGAVVISPKAPIQKPDPFDLPPAKLQKFAQGLIWRDEHFDGASIKSIARRENCSQDYVGSAIFYSFDTLIAAL